MSATNRKSLLVLGLAIAVGSIMQLTGIAQPLEIRLFDWLQHRFTYDRVADERVIVVTITDADVHELGWPLSDAALARVLASVLQSDPAAVGVDLYRDLPIGAGRDALLKQLSDPRVVAAERFPAGDEGVPCPPSDQGAIQCGFTDLIPDADGTIRRALLHLDDGLRSGTALALAITLKLLARSGIHPVAALDDPDVMRLGEATLPPLDSDFGGYAGIDARGYQIMLTGSSHAVGLVQVTVGEVLKKPVGELDFANKIVVIGFDSKSVNDVVFVPSRSFADGVAQIPGVELHARIAAQLLGFAEGWLRPLRAFPVAAEFLFLVVSAALALLATRFTRKSARSAAGVLLLMLLPIAVGASAAASVWLPLLPALTSAVVMLILVLWTADIKPASRSGQPRVFVSYRRDGGAAYAGRLVDHLNASFGAENVFHDIGTITPGADFVTTITDALRATDVLILVINPGWPQASSEDGLRRLWDERDFVRREILLAFEHEVRIIPVLTGGANMPAEEELPAALAPLARINATVLDDDRWHEDTAALVSLVSER